MAIDDTFSKQNKSKLTKSQSNAAWGTGLLATFATFPMHLGIGSEVYEQVEKYLLHSLDWGYDISNGIAASAGLISGVTSAAVTFGVPALIVAGACKMYNYAKSVSEDDY